MNVAQRVVYELIRQMSNEGSWLSQENVIDWPVKLFGCRVS